MEKIDRSIDLTDDRIQITSTSMTLLWRLIEKQDEIVNWINEYEREQELKELRLFERMVKMIDERVGGGDPAPK